MRILHVVPSYLPAHRYGGPIYSVHGLCKALAEKGHDVHVFTTNVDGTRDSNVPLSRPVSLEGVKVWYFPSRYLRRLFWSPPMASALEQILPSFDIVHLHSVFLWPTWAAARVARRYSVPYVLAPRGMLVKDLIQRKSRWLKTAWIILIERHNLEHAALLHLTSALEAQELAKFSFRCPSIVKIPNGIESPPPAPDIRAASPTLRTLLGKYPTILFLSRVHWKKGVDQLIQAMTHLDPPVQLIVAGNDEEGYLPKLRALTQSLRLRDRVHFTGAVHGDDKEVLLRQADVFVLPSVYPENFGNVVLEAMIRQCPVVISPEFGLAEWVRQHKAGRVSSSDPQTLAATLRHSLNDSAETLAMAQRAADAAKQFMWPTVANDMERAYQSCLRSTATASRRNDQNNSML